MTTRRSWMRMALAAAAGTMSGHALTQPKLDAPPFQLGVASGMPGADSVVLWTRLLPMNPLGNVWGDQAVAVRWELAEDEAFRKVVRRGTTDALPALAHSVHVEVEGLPPSSHFYYRFLLSDAVSPTGRTRTLPSPDEPVARLRLAFASCQRLSNGYFGAWQRLLDDTPDMVAFLGDYIYDSGAYPSPTVPRGIAPALTLDGYRAHYELHKRDPQLQAAHAGMPWLIGWDDHEVFNDYAGGPLKGLDGGRLGRQRRAAYQAFYEHMPVRSASLVRGARGLREEGAELRLYTSAAWGRLAALNLLDCRQYRSEQACSGIGGLVLPESCSALADPSRTMLGAAQEAWLDAELMRQRRGQGRPWTLLLQSTMFSPRRIPFMGGHRIWNDGWDGYPEARSRLISALQRHDVAGPIFLGGDLHENWAVNVPAGSGPGVADRTCVASEFVGTGITMKSFAPKAIGEIQAANPHALYADAGQCGYGLLDITAARSEVAFRVVDSLYTPDPQVRTAAAFVIEAGDPQIRPS